jgi:hypothetical protein
MGLFFSPAPITAVKAIVVTHCNGDCVGTASVQGYCPATSGELARKDQPRMQISSSFERLA